MEREVSGVGSVLTQLVDSREGNCNRKMFCLLLIAVGQLTLDLVLVGN